MPFVVTCPSCRSGLRVATRKKGHQIACPKCSQTIVAYGDGRTYAINPAHAIPLADYVPPSRSTSGSKFALVALFLILLAFPAAWTAALQYRAEHQEEILAALGASDPSIPTSPAEPAASQDILKEEPKDKPIVVASLDVPAVKSPAIVKGEPTNENTTTLPRKQPPKVVALPPPEPSPIIIAKVEPPPLPPRVDSKPAPPKIVPSPPKIVPPPPPLKTPAELKVEIAFDEIRRFPAASEAQNRLLQALSPLPRFGAEIDEYNHDGFNPFANPGGDFEAMKAQYPLRVMAYELSQRLVKGSQLKVQTTVASPIDAKQKSRVPGDQKPVALVILSLQDAVDDAQTVAGLRDKEKSKRWQAHFDLALVRAQARLVYLYEYNNLLAAIRTESLPALEAGERGWRFAPCPKVQTKEATVKDLAKQVAKGWERIGREYPNTPWSFVAEQERDAPLGLEWVAQKK